MKKIPSFHLQFPRLFNLEKRIGGQAELSVDQIRILEKKLITSIQEISSSLEKDEDPIPSNGFSVAPQNPQANEQTSEIPAKTVKRKIEDGSKQACLDEYFMEKNPINENSTGFKSKPPKTPKDLMKSPISSPMPFQSALNLDYEKEIKTLKEKLTEKDKESR